MTKPHAKTEKDPRFNGILQSEQTHDYNSKAKYGQVLALQIICLYKVIALLLYINSQVKTLLYEK